MHFNAFLRDFFTDVYVGGEKNQTKITHTVRTGLWHFMARVIPLHRVRSFSQDTCLTMTYHFQVRDILEFLGMLQSIQHCNLCYSCF